MAFPIIPDNIKKLWDVWDLRVAILISLSFQILLVLTASLRKRKGNIILTMFIWSAYLLADWIATFAIGLIANGSNNCSISPQSEDLMAFWAPFLLLHLGGPDAITAFSLEDNELWLRHFLQLVVHLVGIAYIFSQSLPNNLWIPTSLVFLAGTIKYAERTRALYLASLGNLKNSMLPPPSPGSNYARLMQVYRSKFNASVPVNIILAETPKLKPPAYSVGEGSALLGFEDIEDVQNGYMFFDIFKGLIPDLTYGYREWQKTREFFFFRNAKAAFRIMEIELNFLYDLLYTKMVVVHRKSGFSFRFICLVSIILAFERFVSHHEHHKHEIHNFDRYVTYTLLLVAIGLDGFAILKLIFSDWTIAALKYPSINSIIFAVRIRLSFDKNFRWSKSVSQHSFITYCLKEQFRWINIVLNYFGVLKSIGIKDFFDEIQYKQTRPVDYTLEEFIFRELRDKALKTDNLKTAKEMCSRRGKEVLSEMSCCHSALADSIEVEYDESVLRWHIATELCYYTTKDNYADSDESRKFSKILSDYMLYLLVMRPTMMSAVAGIVQVRFQDTCEEAKKFFRGGEELPKTFLELAKKNYFRCGSTPSMAPLDVCDKLLSVDTVVEPRVVKGGTSRSVLFDACMMASDLGKLEEETRWRIMSRVWVELLSYAASHCRANAHAQQLSKGGELITFVWLLMIHFGVGEQFRVDPESRYKLIVAK